ncbi:MAG: nucleotidyltransferase domain-containing protein, partial [Thermodesulfovibrionales bacterium]|nr:nucleotidyltransferase domain-containing protein [Thermodesulfovibrionales bacterium]
MNQKIEKIKEILRANSGVEFAYLFGSRAKGISGERSDWDIAIYFRKDPQKLSKWTVFYLEAELSKEIGNEVQITVLNNLDSPVFLFQIINDGLLL